MCSLSAFLLLLVMWCWKIAQPSKVWFEFSCNVRTIVAVGLPPLALFVRETGIHMMSLIFLQITSTFQWWVNPFHALYPNTDLGLNIGEDWEGPLWSAPSSCHDHFTRSLVRSLPVSSVVTLFKGIKHQEINGHPKDCPLSSSLSASPVLSFYNYYSSYWCMASHRVYHSH